MIERGLLGILASIWLMVEAVGQTTAIGKTDNVRTASSKGLKGEYYAGRNYEKKMFTRYDPEIRFDWLHRTPGPGMPESFFSVRWTGKLYAPETGEYKFTAKVDDGIRLWVGGKKVLDIWELNDSKTFYGSIVLKGGQYYDLRVDYFNDILEGEITLLWITPKAARQNADIAGGFPGSPITDQYLFNPEYQPPKPNRKPSKEPVASTKPITTAKPVKSEPIQAEPVQTKPKPVLVRAERPVPSPVEAKQPDTVAARIITPTPANETFDGLKSGDAIILKNILFEQSKYILLSESFIELDKLANTLTKYPQLRIEIVGHTDNVGDPRLNLALSENRAKVVASYLVRKGIDYSRLETKGYGGTRPIADNSIEAERAKNRRVEFLVK